MAARKKSSSKDFNNNPFKSLKGLSVSGQIPAKTTIKQSSSSLRQDKGAPTAEDNDQHLFEREMGWLGVHRLNADVSSEGADESAGEEPLLRLPETPSEEDDAAFALAMNGIEPAFKDEWADGEQGAPLPRRRRLFKRGQEKPEAELDLHGLNREEALTRVGYFLENARHHGFRVVLVITGKGDRSGGAGVLRSAVGAYLSGQTEQVLEWFEAPRQYGGRGALVVYLRRERNP